MLLCRSDNELNADNPAAWFDPVLRGDLQYLVWQLESGQDETPHYQGYAYFGKAQTFAGVRDLGPRGHWEPRKGTHEQARTYCTKEASRVEGPWELGSPPAQGYYCHSSEQPRSFYFFVGGARYYLRWDSEEDAFFAYSVTSHGTWFINHLGLPLPYISRWGHSV